MLLNWLCIVFTFKAVTSFVVFTCTSMRSRRFAFPSCQRCSWSVCEFGRKTSVRTVVLTSALCSRRVDLWHETKGFVIDRECCRWRAAQCLVVVFIYRIIYHIVLCVLIMIILRSQFFCLCCVSNTSDREMTVYTWKIVRVLIPNF